MAQADRMSMQHTRALLKAALANELDNVATELRDSSATNLEERSAALDGARARAYCGHD